MKAERFVLLIVSVQGHLVLPLRGYSKTDCHGQECFRSRMLTFQQLKSKQKERRDSGTKHTLQMHTPITCFFQLSLALSSFYDLSIAFEAKNLPPPPRLSLRPCDPAISQRPHHLVFLSSRHNIIIPCQVHWSHLPFSNLVTLLHLNLSHSELTSHEPLWGR